jgi:hypothetical protein
MRSKTSIFNYVSAEGPFLLQLAGSAAAGSYTRCYNRGLSTLKEANNLELYNEYVRRDLVSLCCSPYYYFRTMGFLPSCDAILDPRFTSTSSIGSDLHLTLSLPITMILHYLNTCAHLFLLRISTCLLLASYPGPHHKQASWPDGSLQYSS